MKILMTSGGTKVPIDRVRDITNKSGGNFASKIARAFFKIADDDITDLTFLRAQDSASPFDFKVNWSQEGTGRVGENLRAFTESFQMWESYGDFYREEEYVDFYDYRRKFFYLLESKRWDLVVTAAAVSDYLVKNYVDGKVRSADQYSIELTEAEKIITQVKRVCPDCHLVGFKLLVDSTDEQLLAAARKVFYDAQCDFVVANDMRDIQSRKHRIMKVTDKEPVIEMGSSDALAKIVASTALETVV